MIIYTSICQAVGFGEIKLYSYLNEPLDAEIELLGTESYDVERLIISLASAQEFKRAGLDRPFFLSQIRFEAIRKNGHTVIHISSKDPVKQPYLDFLIDLSWPGGRLVRGYTMLLDPAPAEGGRLHERFSQVDPNAIHEPELNRVTIGSNSPQELKLANLDNPDNNVTQIMAPKVNGLVNGLGAGNEDHPFSLVQQKSLYASKNTLGNVDILNSTALAQPNDPKLQGVGVVKGKPSKLANIPTYPGPTTSSKTEQKSPAGSIPRISNRNLARQETGNSLGAQLYEPLFEPEKHPTDETPIPITMVSKETISSNSELATEARDQNGRLMGEGQKTVILSPEHSGESLNSMSHAYPMQSDPRMHSDSVTHAAASTLMSGGPTTLNVNFNVKQMMLVVICLLLLFAGIVGTLQLIRKRRNDSESNLLQSLLPKDNDLSNLYFNPQASGFSDFTHDLNLNHLDMSLSGISSSDPYHSTSFQEHSILSTSGLNTASASDLSINNELLDKFKSSLESPLPLGKKFSYGSSIPEISIAALQSEADKIYHSLYENETSIEERFAAERLAAEGAANQELLNRGSHASHYTSSYSNVAEPKGLGFETRQDPFQNESKHFTEFEPSNGLSEEAELKINLARQYLDLDDRENAMQLLSKVLNEGSEREKEIARQLLQHYHIVGHG